VVIQMREFLQHLHAPIFVFKFLCTCQKVTVHQEVSVVNCGVQPTTGSRGRDLRTKVRGADASTDCLRVNRCVVVMKLPRSLRSGERNGAERRFSQESDALLGRQDVVLFVSDFQARRHQAGVRKRALRDSSRRMGSSVWNRRAGKNLSHPKRFLILARSLPLSPRSN
jgi:hypothetical protein